MARRRYWRCCAGPASRVNLPSALRVWKTSGANRKGRIMLGRSARIMAVTALAAAGILPAALASGPSAISVKVGAASCSTTAV